MSKVCIRRTSVAVVTALSLLMSSNAVAAAEVSPATELTQTVSAVISLDSDSTSGVYWVDVGDGTRLAVYLGRLGPGSDWGQVLDEVRAVIEDPHVRHRRPPDRTAN